MHTNVCVLLAEETDYKCKQASMQADRDFWFFNHDRKLGSWLQGSYEAIFEGALSDIGIVHIVQILKQ